jgi:hypothetical protein
MLLYHTTRGDILESVLNRGLLPANRDGVVRNAQAMSSKDGLVYFARFAELNYAFRSRKTGPGLIFEVDSDKISSPTFCPDEDTIAEQRMRERGFNDFLTDPDQIALFQTLVVRIDPTLPEFRREWCDYYRASNLVTFLGDVPNGAIRRYVTMDLETMPEVRNAYQAWYRHSARATAAVDLVAHLTRTLFDRTCFFEYAKRLYEGNADVDTLATRFCEELMAYSASHSVDVDTTS